MTLAPRAALINTVPIPVPKLVTDPDGLMLIVERVIPLAKSLLLFRVRFPVPVTPPEMVKIEAEPPVLLLTIEVPLLFTVIGPLTVSAEETLPSMTLVTLEPTAALTSTTPKPVPEFVIVPAGFTDVTDKVTPLATSLLFLNTRLPVPAIPPETVRRAATAPVVALVKVVPELLTASEFVLTVNAEVKLFSVTAVIFAPTPPLKVPAPAPVPELVIVPAIFTKPEKTRAPAAVVRVVRFAVPVIAPPKVPAAAAALET